MKFNSWKTTLGGIVSILTGLGMFGNILNNFGNGDPVSLEQVTIAIGAIATGVSLVFARDNNVTSEQAGAAPSTPSGFRSHGTWCLALVVLASVAIGTTGCPPKAKVDKSVRDAKNLSAKIKIYTRNIQRANNEGFRAGDLSRTQLSVATRGVAKFNSIGIKTLDKAIATAEAAIRAGQDVKTALDAVEAVLNQTFVKAFDEMVEAVTGFPIVSQDVKNWIAGIRLALTALRTLIAGAHVPGGLSNA